MNTTTNTKLTLSIHGSQNLRKRGATQMSKQAVHPSHTKTCSSHWPSNAKASQVVSTVTNAPSTNSKYTTSNMKTLNIRKFTFVALGLMAVVLLGTALVNEKGLAVAGDYVGYLAALAILALGAMDNVRTKKLV